jgi:hypothetical protein
MVRSKKVPENFWKVAKNVLKRHTLSLYGLYYCLQDFDWNEPMTEQPLEELSPMKLDKSSSNYKESGFS